MPGMKRLNIIVSGFVQGVGFRATVRSLARSLGITGWVKNLADGCVEMEIEGEEAVLNRLQQEILREFRGYIESTKVREMEIQGESSFQIRF
jgi:acylphosphatase